MKYANILRETWILWHFSELDKTYDQRLAE